MTNIGYLVKERKEKFEIIPNMETYQKLKHENKILKNIKYHCKQLFKYVKSKIKIQKIFITVRSDKTGELTNTQLK